MAGYRIDAARPHVLAAIESGVTGPHHPESYAVHVAASEAERWAEVFCSCGVASRADWRPGETPDYLGALSEAWAGRPCGTQ